MWVRDLGHQVLGPKSLLTSLVTTTIRWAFDARSTVSKVIKCTMTYVTWAADPLAAVTLTYLFTQVAAQLPGRGVGRRMVVAGRIAVQS